MPNVSQGPALQGERFKRYTVGKYVYEFYATGCTLGQWRAFLRDMRRLIKVRRG